MACAAVPPCAHPFGCRRNLRRLSPRPSASVPSAAPTRRYARPFPAPSVPPGAGSRRSPAGAPVSIRVPLTLASTSLAIFSPRVASRWTFRSDWPVLAAVSAVKRLPKVLGLSQHLRCNRAGAVHGTEEAGVRGAAPGDCERGDRRRTWQGAASPTWRSWHCNEPGRRRPGGSHPL